MKILITLLLQLFLLHSIYAQSTIIDEFNLINSILLDKRKLQAEGFFSSFPANNWNCNARSAAGIFNTNRALEEKIKIYQQLYPTSTNLMKSLQLDSVISLTSIQQGKNSNCPPQGSCKKINSPQCNLLSLQSRQIQNTQNLNRLRKESERKEKEKLKENQRVERELSEKAKLAQINGIAPVDDANFRRFTGKNGITVTAKLVGFSLFKKQAEIMEPSGDTYTVHLSELSRKDFDYLRKWWP